MVKTIVTVSAEGGVPYAIQDSPQDVFPGGDVYGHLPHCHHLGPGGHRSSPSRFGRRLHCHHHRHLLKGSNSLACRQGHGDLSHGMRKHQGGSHHVLRGRRASRGLQDNSVHEHGPHRHRRMYRSLSPHHLMHNRSSDSSLVSPRRGHGGHRGHVGRVTCDGHFHVNSSREHHLHNHSQDINSGSESDRSSPLPGAIE